MKTNEMNKQRRKTLVVVIRFSEMWAIVCTTASLEFTTRQY